MSSIEPYTPSSLPNRSSAGGRLARQTARDLAAIDQGTDITTARIAAAGEIQQVKVDAVARTGAYAMQQVALVSQVQQQLALAAPAASGDLDFIKTMTVVGVGQIVAGTGRAVNRR
ncbi:hypothetical protein Gbro_1441 [Gordonia bronchialis DSM 43247]|uniref:Uncharacterized protein n=1 Tax=Gordonia bronchialis (strain ATCC 25592 / DSM 43247 / BCRC 13721 / JCM 3198 / KCTC 3076 / NBRC 16047 / NCTC 10667) TaxID=526226 RepID=D0L6G6_GORB4|nr:hypothetical protein [Gordonia bronchialis]ACY20723.1 hypothetical protein Gbro_1441 [Gordonia bronchialis DSM 43247]MCC3323496.1 hypothetical protein [Gordonia bronchialis]QGS25527.1 hypothetical protein FOB84_16670 [Gordonia bronchialis]STQ63552.1 Uncharacterised protein [Gordonia bronchialis]